MVLGGTAIPSGNFRRDGSSSPDRHEPSLMRDLIASVRQVTTRQRQVATMTCRFVALFQVRRFSKTLWMVRREGSEHPLLFIQLMILVSRSFAVSPSGGIPPGQS